MDANAACGGRRCGGLMDGGSLPPFLSKTYDMVDDPSTDGIVSWGPLSNSFVVWNPPEFARDLLPKHFKHNNFSSFVRQLNTYGFRKVDPDRWEFANEGFVRGQKHLLKSINRRKPSSQVPQQSNNFMGNTNQQGGLPLPQQQQQQQQQHQQMNATSIGGGACVELGKIGIDEEIDCLKRDKTVLMTDLVRLRQQQQTTDSQLHVMGQRLQSMEQRQQQMMSFLAKAMQSREFLTQLTKKNDKNRRIVNVKKKRRIPTDGGTLQIESNQVPMAMSNPDGQIVRYRSHMNDSAKSKLMQVLGMDGRVGSPEDALSSASESEDPLMEEQASLGGDACFTQDLVGFPPAQPPHPVIPEIHQTPIGVADIPIMIPEAMDAASQSFPPTMVDISDMVAPMPQMVMGGGQMDQAAAMSMGMRATRAPTEAEIGLMVDESPSLVGINDECWEQFFVGIPATGKGDEIDSVILESIRGIRPELQASWERARNTDTLAYKLGLLSS